MKGYRIAVIENLGITEVLWVAFSPKNIARGRASERNVPDVSFGALGATRAQDGFDTIDLSENELTTVDNVPLLPRLRTLMLARNKISVSARVSVCALCVN
jgi:hypothetical protein